MPSSGKTTPRVLDAIRFITTRIDSGQYPPGEILPPVRKLSAQAGVSLVTMWKAVDRLKKDGRLTGRSGETPRVAGKPRDDGPPTAECGRLVNLRPARNAVRQRLADRIRSDILNGRYQPGTPLPQYKRLEHDYGTSWRSLKSVLADLCGEGVVQAKGKTYVVPQFSAESKGAVVGFLAFEEHLEFYNLGMPQGHDYIKDTRLYASQAGVRLIVEPYHGTESSGHDVDSQSVLFSDSQPFSVLGHIFILSESSGIDHLLRRMVSGNKPLAIVEQNGYWQVPSWLRQYPVLIIPLGVTPDCGVIMGRYLLGLGHRKAAFFSPFHPAVWSVARHQGLSTAFEQAGLPDAVVPCYVEPDTLFYAESGYRGDPSAVPILKIQWPKGHTESALRKETRRMESLLQAKLDVAVAMRDSLKGLFEQTLKDREITAWVGANDEVAAAALEFLKSEGVKVPQEISVAAFDDSFHAEANQLTSYNFNIPAIMATSVRHVLQGTPGPSSKRAKVVNIDGMVIQRQTTGPAPGNK